jgi:hypothetical protein
VEAHSGAKVAHNGAVVAQNGAAEVHQGSINLLRIQINMNVNIRTEAAQFLSWEYFSTFRYCVFQCSIVKFMYSMWSKYGTRYSIVAIAFFS